MHHAPRQRRHALRPVPPSARAPRAARLACRASTIDIPPLVAHVSAVRERLTGDYEPEGSEQRTTGSVAVSADAWWSAALIVPQPEGDTVLLRLERHGSAPEAYRGGADSLVVTMPASEVDAVLTLLGGVVAHARRDGVLAARSPEHTIEPSGPEPRAGRSSEGG